MTGNPAREAAERPVTIKLSFCSLWLLITIYAVARILQLFPGRVPMLPIVALHVLPPMLFALIQGAMLYRVRGILVFFTICVLVGNIVENIGVRTALPFGRYYFTEVMGPKLFSAPILLGLAYVGMGYLSWTLSRVILGCLGKQIRAAHLVTLPLLAAFIMVAWDFSMDPTWSTIVQAWVWEHGGIYFGVPLGNFLGWYLTVYLIFQLFALSLRGREANSEDLPQKYWQMTIVFYAVSAIGNVLLAIPRPVTSMVTDGSGAQWQARHCRCLCFDLDIPDGRDFCAGLAQVA
ncbi:MAG: carotenoid biosynthesis protein [Candidatus Acidiferrales bacterium]